MTLVLPLTAFPAGVVLPRIPYHFSVGVALILFFAPLPILIARHWLGRRGWWSVAALAISAIPYFIVVAGMFWEGSANHIPL